MSELREQAIQRLAARLEAPSSQPIYDKPITAALQEADRFEYAESEPYQCQHTIRLNGVTYRCCRIWQHTGVHDARHKRAGAPVRW